MWRITINAQGIIQAVASADNACPIEAARHDNPWVVDVDAPEEHGLPDSTSCHVANPSEVREGEPAVLVWYSEEERARARAKPSTPAAWDTNLRDWVDARDATYRAGEQEQVRLVAVEQIKSLEQADLRALREVALALVEGKQPPAAAVTKLRALDAEATRLRPTAPPGRQEGV